MADKLDNPLGREVDYVDQYCPELLFPIARSQSRKGLGIAVDALPFVGVDIWNAYELSWLDSKGKPEAACAEFRIPCDSPSIIESKSFKLYLNSFNQSVFADAEAVAAALRKDLSAVAGAGVEVLIRSADGVIGEPLLAPAGDCLDGLDIAVSTYLPDPDLLQADPQCIVSEQLYSHLLRSLCPVTGQPDWGTVCIDYRGPKLDRSALLTYIIGFRQHQDFHEHCVERMFTDIWRQCSPQFLNVYARYVRRGGLDINPYRSSASAAAPNSRLYRQ